MSKFALWRRARAICAAASRRAFLRAKILNARWQHICGAAACHACAFVAARAAMHRASMIARIAPFVCARIACGVTYRRAYRAAPRSGASRATHQNGMALGKTGRRHDERRTVASRTRGKAADDDARTACAAAACRASGASRQHGGGKTAASNVNKITSTWFIGTRMPAAASERSCRWHMA